jgi:hypothetical protein
MWIFYFADAAEASALHASNPSGEPANDHNDVNL